LQARQIGIVQIALGLVMQDQPARPLATAQASSDLGADLWMPHGQCESLEMAVGISGGDSLQYPRATSLEHDFADSVGQPDASFAVTLADVMQQTGDDHIRIGHAPSDKKIRDPAKMLLIECRHVFEVGALLW
jgi:hypothetical protein